MARSVAKETAFAVILTTALTFFGAGILELSGGRDAASAFFDAGPRLVIATAGITLLLWAVLIAVGNVRNRRRASVWSLLTNLATTLACACLTVLVWLLLALFAGSWALFLVALSIASCLIFVVAATISLLLTHLVLFRGSPPRR